MSISSNYDYYSQIGSAQIWQRMIQNGYAQDNSNAQEAVSSVGTAGQASASQNPPSPLAGLVSDGTITSEQEQAIKEALETARMAYATQAGAQNASSNATLKDPLSSLVSSGTITEEQKEAVSEALKSGMKANGMRGMPPPPPDMMQNNGSDALTGILDKLVESGAITSEQQQTISSLFQSAISAYMAQSGSGWGLQANSFEMNL